MRSRNSLSNIIHLGLQVTFLYLTFNFLRALLHELGHGLAATLVGLEFKGFYGSVFGSSGAWINGARSPFQSVAISTGGPLVDLIIGLIALFVVLPHVKKWGGQISWLLLATTTMVSFWGLMMSSGFGTGDFANVAHSLSIPKFIFGLLGILGLVGFLFLLAKRMFRLSSEYFSFYKFPHRFGLLFLFLGLPTTIWVLGYVLITGKFVILGQLVLVLGIVCLLSALIPLSSKNVHPLPPIIHLHRSFKLYSLLYFVALCIRPHLTESTWNFFQWMTVNIRNETCQLVNMV
jgi:hypothetical protein